MLEGEDPEETPVDWDDLGGMNKREMMFLALSLVGPILIILGVFLPWAEDGSSGISWAEFVPFFYADAGMLFIGPYIFIVIAIVAAGLHFFEVMKPARFMGLLSIVCTSIDMYSLYQGIVLVPGTNIAFGWYSVGIYVIMIGSFLTIILGRDWDERFF